MTKELSEKEMVEFIQETGQLSTVLDIVSSLKSLDLAESKKKRKKEKLSQNERIKKRS